MPNGESRTNGVKDQARSERLGAETTLVIGKSYFSIIIVTKTPNMSNCKAVIHP